MTVKRNVRFLSKMDIVQQDACSWKEQLEKREVGTLELKLEKINWYSWD